VLSLVLHHPVSRTHIDTDLLCRGSTLVLPPIADVLGTGIMKHSEASFGSRNGHFLMVG